MLSDMSTAIITVSTLMPTVATIAVGLRLSARKIKSQALEIDDYLILAALFVVIASDAGHIAGAVAGGVGFHMDTLKPHTVITFFKFNFALQFTYLLAVTLIKLSVLLCYKRIFVTPRFVLAIKIMCTVVVAWFITFFFATLLQTIPIPNNWAIPGTTQSSSTHINVYAMYTTTAALEITLDVVTLILPLFVIWRLQMRPVQKWQVSGIFLLGSFVCVASILRLYYLVVHLNPSVQEEQDLTYNLGNIILWSGLEPSTGVICACLPALGPIFQRRTLQSLIHNLRSLFSLSSRRGHDSQRSLPIHHEHAHLRRQNDSRPFYPMDDQKSLVTTVQPDAKDQNLLEDLPLESIMMNSSMEAHVDQRVM